MFLFNFKEFLFRMLNIFTKLYYFEALRGNCTGPMRPADTLTSLIRAPPCLSLRYLFKAVGSYEASIKLLNSIFFKQVK
jgi:hypothetical protein